MMEKVDFEVPAGEYNQYPHRRAGEQRLEILSNSPLAKVLIWMVNAIFLPISAWGMIAILSEVRELNLAIAKNNTVTAVFEVRMSTLEASKIQRDIAVKVMSDKLIDHESRINYLERDQRDQRDKK